MYVSSSLPIAPAFATCLGGGYVSGGPAHKTAVGSRLPIASGFFFGGGVCMLGGWVNPHREQTTIPQGQTSIPPKSLSTPTANGQIAP